MKLGAVEAKFADLVWSHEPLSSGELVKQCERGIFQNENGTVTSLLSRAEFYAIQSEAFVEETFAGSLPSFIAAFTQRKTLTAEEAAEIRKLIERM